MIHADSSMNFRERKMIQSSLTPKSAKINQVRAYVEGNTIFKYFPGMLKQKTLWKT